MSSTHALSRWLNCASRHLQLIAERNLSGAEISSAHNDPHLALNRFFHKSQFHQIIVSSRGNAPLPKRDLHFYAYLVIPSFDGEPPEPTRHETFEVLRDFLTGFSELASIRIGLMEWPKYSTDDMYEYISQSPVQSLDDETPLLESLAEGPN